MNSSPGPHKLSVLSYKHTQVCCECNQGGTKVLGGVRSLAEAKKELQEVQCRERLIRTRNQSWRWSWESCPTPQKCREIRGSKILDLEGSQQWELYQPSSFCIHFVFYNTSSRWTVKFRGSLSRCQSPQPWAQQIDKSILVQKPVPYCDEIFSSSLGLCQPRVAPASPQVVSHPKPHQAPTRPPALVSRDSTSSGSFSGLCQQELC